MKLAKNCLTMLMLVLVVTFGFNVNIASAAKYMTQPMSYSTLTRITYFRAQQQDHPSHKESSKFTRDAKADYATTNNIRENQVEAGRYKSGQGIPTVPNAKEI